MTMLYVGIGSAVAGIFGSSRAAREQKRATAAAREAAAEQNKLAREELDFFKQQYADMKPAQLRAAEVANQVSTQQLASMVKNDAISDDYWNYQKNTFRPLEGKLVAEAQNYDTEAKRKAKVGQAMADVEQQFGNEAAQQKRAMTRMGVNPSSGAFAALSNEMSMAEAAAKANAANKARDSVETQGFARRMDAASLGRNLPSSQATSAGIALNSGNMAVSNAGAPINQGINMTNMMGNGYRSSAAGMQNANSMMNTANQNSANLWAKSSGDMMSAAATAAGIHFGKK